MPAGRPGPVRLQRGDGLLVVDVQNDFLPGGSLAVPEGDLVVPVLNRYLETFERRRLPIVATRDWHPPGHASFTERGGPWPAHCVAASHGAQFPATLRLPDTTLIVAKGENPREDAYSGFQGTGLAERLKREGIRRLFVGGLATDYCVLHTVKDARQAQFTVYLLEDAIRAVNLKPDDGRAAMEGMRRLGAVPMTLAQLAD